MKKGKMIVIEGVDGSGKQTQSDLLYKNLKDNGYKVKKVTYPNYKSESSSLVKMYLRGDFGKDPSDVSPYISSTFFAADRYASYKTDYESFYKDGGIIIADRYTTSNMVHQAGKIENIDEKNKFLDWLWNLEFKLYGIPVPDLVLFLDINPDYSKMLIKNRKNKITKQNKKDIHETSIDHIEKSYDNAKFLIEKYNWKTVECINKYNAKSELKTIEEISETIYKIVKEKI